MAHEEKIHLPSKAKPHTTIATRRICCCPAWLFLTILCLIIVIPTVTIPIVVVKLNARPQRPSFHVTSLKITQLNFTKTLEGPEHHLTNYLISKLNLTISVQNPNKDAVFFYDTITFDVFSWGFSVGSGYFGSSFVQENETSTTLQASISNTSEVVTKYSEDYEALDLLKQDVYKNGELHFKISLTTSVGVKMGGKLKNKVGFDICCPGIKAVAVDHASPPTSWELPQQNAVKCCILNAPFSRFKWG
ncbi:Late embryogenesis abundant protein [Macleaya cordata]|uniref:Late embryogenesis abundant protein n=1 Tax=Macleaya cordata TaxID=56857 RepID=A0A200Q0L4_MACCD|nr:Late embryogenesis abundant protein [Macleaya cordata]